MKKVLIVYYGGKESAVKKMAMKIAEGARGEGTEVTMKATDEAQADDLLGADAIILGAPSFYGGLPADMKRFIDQTFRLQGKLEGKVGAAFSSSEYLGGGSETTILALLTTLLFHGMIVQGSSQGYHFGPITLNPTGKEQDLIENDENHCRKMGLQVACLLKRLV